MPALPERGTFRNTARARQLLRFDGLRWGTITPTDFDLFVDFGGRGFVLGEIKRAGTVAPTGQRLAIERFADASTVPTLAFVAHHEVDIGDVVVADVVVSRTRFGGRWRDNREGSTVRELCDRFHAYVYKQAA